MDSLYAPWRIEYILAPKPPSGDVSLFTRIAGQRLFIYLATALLSAGGIWAAFSGSNCG